MLRLPAVVQRHEDRLDTRNQLFQQLITGIPQLYPPEGQSVCSGEFLDRWNQFIPSRKHSLADSA